MENLEVFREAELRIIYRHRRHILLVQCFQEKFEMVQSQIQKLRSQLSTIIIPVKSPILSRHYVKSNEIQRIACMMKIIISIEFYLSLYILAMSTCIINIEQLTDHNRPNGLINIDLNENENFNKFYLFTDCLINLKVTGRSVEKINLAQRLIKEFEEQRYSTKKIQNNDIRLFNEQDVCKFIFTHSIKKIL